MQLERKFFTQDDLPVCEDCYKVSLDHDGSHSGHGGLGGGGGGGSMVLMMMAKAAQRERERAVAAGPCHIGMVAS